jgi:hypothetical protein
MIRQPQKILVFSTKMGRVLCSAYISKSIFCSLTCSIGDDEFGAFLAWNDLAIPAFRSGDFSLPSLEPLVLLGLIVVWAQENRLRDLQ